MKKITTKKPFVVTCLSFASNLLRYQERERERERDVTWKNNFRNETFV